MAVSILLCLVVGLKRAIVAIRGDASVLRKTTKDELGIITVDSRDLRLNAGEDFAAMFDQILSSRHLGDNLRDRQVASRELLNNIGQLLKGLFILSLIHI